MVKHSRKSRRTRRHRGGDDVGMPAGTAAVPLEAEAPVVQEKSWFQKLKERVTGTATAGRRRRKKTHRRKH